MEKEKNNKVPFEASKLREMMMSLTKRQRNDLLHFIEMKSLRLKEYEIEIFQILAVLQEKKKIKNITQEDVIKLAKSDNELLKKKWNYISSNLLQAIYRYLISSKGSFYEMPEGYSLLEYLREKNLQTNHNALFNKLDKHLHSNSPKDNNYFFYEFQLLRLQLEDTRHERKKSNSFDLYKESLDNFYLENRLRILCEQINRQEIINIKTDDSDIPYWEQRFDLKTHSKPTVKLFYNIYKMLSDSENGEQHFFEVKNDIQKKDKLMFSKSDIKTAYENLSNFCIYSLNAGEEKWSDEYIDLIHSQENENILLQNKTITPQKYKNSISAGLISGRINWVEDFIKKYQKKLPAQQEETVIQYNKANLEFHKGNFQESFDTLINYNPLDFYYRISYGKLLLKVYFELNITNKKLNYDQAIDSRIDSFIKFIKDKDTLTFKNQASLLNFISYYQKMKEGVKFSLEELEATIPISDYIWFKKKLGSSR